MEEIVVHQTLHGYSDGHSLLATSSDLSSEEKFSLLKMSDLSGSISGSEFDPYITAYPLSNQFYAIAKTWPASEMPRPGCVWTHTILVSPATLGRIENLAELVKLFQKPSKGMVQGYQRSLRVRQGGRSNLLATPEFLNLLAILYGSNKSVILLSPPSNIEQLLFETWNYQWPRLRRSFSFSIGSFAPRQLGSKPLDFQVMNHRDFHFGNTGRGDFAVHHSLSKLTGDSNWTELVVDSDMNEVLSFMYKYGSDVDPIRTKYVDLFLAYHINIELESLESPINRLFSFFRTHFQGSSEAKTLKRDLILKAFESDKRNLYYFLILANENENNLAPFSEINWNYSEIIEELWLNQIISLHELQSLLTQIGTNNLNAEFFSKLPIESWIGNGYVTGSFVNELLRFNPQLIANDVIWSQEKSIQNTFFDALLKNQSNGSSAGLFPKVIQSMIMNDNDLFAQDIVLHFGSEAVALALNASESTGHNLPAEWERQALGFVNAIINHVIEGKISNYKLTLLLKVANDISTLSTARIINLIEKINKIQNANVVRLNCIIISNCFKNQLKDSGRIFARLFQRVHDLAKTGNLNSTDWDIVFYSMPKNRRLIPNKSKSWFFGGDEDDVPFWDRCESIRRAMLECFVQYNWGIDFFFESVHDSDTLKRMAKFAVKSNVGYNFMIGVTMSQPGKKFPEQLKTIHKVLEKKK